MSARLGVTYRVRSDAASIEARAQVIAVEQSVEMPLEAIDEPTVLRDIVGEVQSIEVLGDDCFAVRIGLAAATIGSDAGQLLNMLFGNTSLHDDVVLHDVAFPDAMVAGFGGPRHGIAGLRRRAGAQHRALTCSALKPQGLSADRLGALAERFARGGIDYIKDDHGLADQDYSRFAERVRACAAAVARATQATGHPTRYVPSLSGDLNAMRRQLALARELGLDCALLAPLIAGFANMQALAAEFSDVAFFAHPSLGGAARIAPALLIGTLFRLIGADAVIFPNYGGRFGYTPDTCRLLADNARAPRDGLRPSLPVAAGGMTPGRVPELLDFYGADAMLLIGGSLLAARERLTEETAAFTRAVAAHAYR
ncbi:MAG TPA: RuBisCO large subunit C-terminal-like domain-containing protein [Acetobacteraceae bacterium]|nr:RuBisCO large subunit C-terminal-like domain-containing protein [Acetobacteraceae bacterium]